MRIPLEGTNSSMDTTESTPSREQNDTSYIGYVIDDETDSYDNIGALYYVVAVVLIYGLSIVMMIASHIRKNQQDNQLRTYLKEMALLRKKDRREKLINRMSIVPPYLKNGDNDQAMAEGKESGSTVNKHEDYSKEYLLVKNNAENKNCPLQMPSKNVYDAAKQSSRASKSEKTPNISVQIINEGIAT